MNTQSLLVVLLGILVLVAGVQAFQLNALSQAISTGSVSLASGTSASGSAATATAPQSSVLSQLPTQVGGC